MYSNIENQYTITVNLRLLTVNTYTFRKMISLLGNMYFHCYRVRRLRTYIFTVREGLSNSEISLLDNKISLLVYNSPGRMKPDTLQRLLNATHIPGPVIFSWNGRRPISNRETNISWR